MTEIYESRARADAEIDITGFICPMTFVRTKLKLESMIAGTVLDVRLKGEEPLLNVPRSARQHGHTVLEIYAEAPNTDDAVTVHHVLIRKEAKSESP